MVHKELNNNNDPTAVNSPLNTVKRFVSKLTHGIVLSNQTHINQSSYLGRRGECHFSINPEKPGIPPVLENTVFISKAPNEVVDLHLRTMKYKKIHTKY